MRLVPAIVLVFADCNDSEKDRETAAMARAIPQRLQSNGTIILSKGDSTALDLTSAVAIDGVLPKTLRRFGVVRARVQDQALVVVPVASLVVSCCSLAIGDSVVAGQAMLDVQPVLGVGERTSMAVQSAELDAQFAVAQNEQAARATELSRLRGLVVDNLVTTAALQNAEAAVMIANTRVVGLRDARSARSRNGAIGSLTLRAPLNGTITSFDAILGGVVEPATPLARIVRSGPRWIDIGALPEDPKGERYEISTNDRWVLAKLLAIGTTVDVDGIRTDRIEVSQSDAGFLLPGASVQVQIQIGTAQGVIIPESALVPVSSGMLVYVETAPLRFTARSVEVAERFSGHARIAQGLRSGERVVTRGAMALHGESLRSELRHSE